MKSAKRAQARWPTSKQGTAKSHGSGYPAAGIRNPVLLSFLVLALQLFVAPAARAEGAGASREYQVKAVFLFNFAQFVDWPSAAFSSPQTPLVIGVLGKDPFDGALDEAVRGETVNGRALEVQRFSRVEDAKECHILFISGSDSARLGRILASLKGKSILTVGDFDGFTEQGGMIRFITDKNRVRFRINLESVKAGGLTISSKLLRPAEIVTSVGKG